MPPSADGTFATIEDRIVKRQRESRGTLIDWPLLAVGPSCESCEQSLYEHAHAYLDGMLEVLLQSDAIVKAGIARVRSPEANIRVDLLHIWPIVGGVTG